jgi:hypothetical protein
VRTWLLALALVSCGARTDLGGRVGLDAGAHPDGAADAAPDATPGACPTTTMLAQTAPQPDTLVLDGAFVYWRDSSGIWRVPKTGGTAQLLAPAVSHFWPDISAFAIGGGFVFYSDDGNGERVPVGGGAPDPLGFTLDIPSFAVGAGHVYVWSHVGFVEISRFDFSGKGLAVVDELPQPPSRMVFVGPTAYAATDPGVWKLDFGAGNQLLSGLTAVDVAVDGTDVYFTSSDATNGARVLVLSMPSLATTPVADTAGAFTLALDATDLYFVDADGQRVRRIAGRTGPVTDVATVGPLLAPVDLAVDDACVYFTASSRKDAKTAGAVMVAPK